MNSKFKLAWFLLIPAFIVFLLILFITVSGFDWQVLSPAGSIGHKERNLLIFGSVLSVLIIVPVFVMTFGIAWRYRQGNHKAEYKPDWDRNRTAEAIWWLVPLVLIIILSVVTWKSSHDLSPYKALASNQKPLTIQVVALQWKWLFIYPEQHIASVNFVQFPEGTPVTFNITSDAPMNSFWIPQLGGQIYAMSGMSTQLHLDATKVGDYHGYSANLSGEGFAGMQFTARASSARDFASWVQTVQRTAPAELTEVSYDDLADPSENNPVAFYAPTQTGLYDTILMKYMAPPTTTNGMPRVLDTIPSNTGEHQHMDMDEH